MIRAARPDDAEAIAALQLRAWRVTYGPYVDAAQLDRPLSERVERWLEWLTDPQGRVVLVSERDGAVDGFVAVGPTRDEEPAGDGIGELYAIYLEPGVVGTGVGRALLEAGEDVLARDHAEATLWVLEPNAQARAFYERHGWAEDSRPYDRGRWGWAPSMRYRKRLR